MQEWTEYSIEVARGLLQHQELGPQGWRQFEDIAAYCRGITSGLMEEDRYDRNNEAELHFDIASWLRDEGGKTLNQFQLTPSESFLFNLRRQVTLLSDLIRRGNTPAGRGQAQVCRKPCFGVSGPYSPGSRSPLRRRRGAEKITETGQKSITILGASGFIGSALVDGCSMVPPFRSGEE
jgi:hypothetical protein